MLHRSDVSSARVSRSLTGGSSAKWSDDVYGKVVNVALNSTFVAAYDSLTTVSLSSMNLKSNTDLVALFPDSVETLHLRNNLIYEFPYSQSDFPALNEL